ncbi:hypothetical protein C8R43DRAFT_610516 [Mycena crocata]|nr:hypothetical protein C8R43DRAFT_610516 [Mycena crocata]
MLVVVKGRVVPPVAVLHSFIDRESGRSSMSSAVHRRRAPPTSPLRLTTDCPRSLSPAAPSQQTGQRVRRSLARVVRERRVRKMSHVDTATGPSQSGTVCTSISAFNTFPRTRYRRLHPSARTPPASVCDPRAAQSTHPPQPPASSRRRSALRSPIHTESRALMSHLHPPARCTLHAAHSASHPAAFSRARAAGILNRVHGLVSSNVHAAASVQFAQSRRKDCCAVRAVPSLAFVGVCMQRRIELRTASRVGFGAVRCVRCAGVDSKIPRPALHTRVGSYAHRVPSKVNVQS